MVDLEHPDPPGQRGAVRERVQPRPQDDVLSDPACRGAGELVLGVAAPAGRLRPGADQHRVRPVRPVVRDELLGTIAEHGLGQRVGEDRRLPVDDQMSRARRRRGHSSKARLPVRFHDGKITILPAY